MLIVSCMMLTHKKTMFTVCWTKWEQWKVDTITIQIECATIELDYNLIYYSIQMFSLMQGVLINQRHKIPHHV